MARRRPPARDVARGKGELSVWIDHAALAPGDQEWLGTVEWLTLWNVTVPEGLLASLPHLSGLDVRGGSGSDVSFVRGCTHLQCLVVNQIRGLDDLDVVAELPELELLSLYGLPRVRRLPSLRTLRRLRRIELGSMKGLESVGELAEAPALEELMFGKVVAGVRDEDLGSLAAHPTLRAFNWFVEDVPLRVVEPVMDRLAHLDRAEHVRPEHWCARK